MEQKNWSAVRKLVGYDRYTSQEAREVLEAIYTDWWLFLNFFQPVRKLISKERVGSKVRKRYDPLPEGAGFTSGGREGQGQAAGALPDPEPGRAPAPGPQELGTAKGAPWVTLITRQRLTLR